MILQYVQDTRFIEQIWILRDATTRGSPTRGAVSTGDRTEGPFFEKSMLFIGAGADVLGARALRRLLGDFFGEAGTGMSDVSKNSAGFARNDEANTIMRLV